MDINIVNEQIKKVAFSDEIYQKIIKVGNKNSLMIDQVGELAAEIRDVIMGIRSSKNFISDIQNRLEVTQSIANDIGKDVNTEIFQSMKEQLQKYEAELDANQIVTSNNRPPNNLPIAPTISAIEKAGQFTVEAQPASHSELYSDANIDKQAILNKIEQDHVPLVDHLLTTPVSNPQKVEVQVKKPYSVDPYREQIQ